MIKLLTIPRHIKSLLNPQAKKLHCLFWNVDVFNTYDVIGCSGSSIISSNSSSSARGLSVRPLMIFHTINFL